MVGTKKAGSRKAQSRSRPLSKRSLGVDRHLHPRKSFHAPRPIFEALEKFSKDNELHESDVQRAALVDFLNRHGYYNPDADPEAN